MNTFNAKHLAGLCMNRMVVDEPLAEQLEIAFGLLIRDGFICEPKPEEETPAIPSLEEVLSAIRILDNSDTEGVAKTVYNLATGEESISDYETWRVTLRLVIDDNEIDRDTSEFSLTELVTGQIGLGDFLVECPTSDIECRVNDFVNDSISSWNGEDDAKFNYTWNIECDFGCDHEVYAEIEIERF